MSKALTMSRHNNGRDILPLLSREYNVQANLRGYFMNIEQFYVAG